MFALHTAANDFAVKVAIILGYCNPRIFSSLAVKNIEASFIFLARLFVYLQLKRVLYDYLEVRKSPMRIGNRIITIRREEYEKDFRAMYATVGLFVGIC